MKRDRSQRPSPTANLALRIDALAAGGDGVGHATIDGVRRAVFVPRVAVGDEVRVAADLSVRPARGRLLELITPGEGRVSAPCVHAEACGGCDWLHLSTDAQRSAREQHLREALPPGFRETPVVLHDVGAPLGYRTRARVRVRASGGRAVVGFHGARTNDIVEIGSCVVLDDRIDAAWATLAALFAGAHGEGEAQIALGREGRPVIDVRWHGRVPSSTYAVLEQQVSRGVWAGGTLWLDDVTRPVVVGDPAPRMRGADGAPMVLAPGGFAQASDAGNVALGSRVLALSRQLVGGPGAEVAHEARRTSVVELYAGAGNFTILLAAVFARVTAVEADAKACEAARENLRARGLEARVTCADADAFAVPPKTDLVVLDPPRRGARTAIAKLAASTVKGIVYVSCDVPTLARDLAALGDRYRALAIESFAMFPGTSHSETVVALRRVRGRDGGS